MKKIKRVVLALVVLIGGSFAFHYYQSSAESSTLEDSTKENTSDTTTVLAASAGSGDTKTVQMVQVGSEDVDLHSLPDSDSKIITPLNSGEYLEYVDETNGWYHVIANNEYEGYVSSLYSERCKVKQSTTPTTLQETTVVLNPGHGGTDTGALSNNEYYYEKDVTLSTAKIIQKTLEAAGCTVILTREGDVTESLADICTDSIENQADVFISLHYDSTEYMNDASGTTTYYYYDQYQELAETVNQALAYTLLLENRGVETGNFHVLRENTRPALLLELGYMNNDYDLATFVTQSYQQQVADALLEGIQSYIEAGK